MRDVDRKGLYLCRGIQKRDKEYVQVKVGPVPNANQTDSSEIESMQFEVLEYQRRGNHGCNRIHELSSYEDINNHILLRVGVRKKEYRYSYLYDVPTKTRLACL